MEAEQSISSQMGALAFAFALVAALLLSLAPADAAAAHSNPFLGMLGSAQLANVDQPTSLAVDQSNGDVYVVDFGSFGNGAAGSIRRFKSNGEPDPFSALGTNVIDAMKGPGGKPCAEEEASCDEIPENGFSKESDDSLGSVDAVQVAIDESGTATDGDIYVTQGKRKLVSIFAADGHYLGQLKKAGTKALGEVSGVAVDPAGNLYVSDLSNGAIDKFTPSANPPTATDFVTAFKAVERPSALAVGAGPTAGYLFVNRRAGTVATFGGGIFKLKLSNGELQYPLVEGIVSPEGFTEIAVDSATGHVFGTHTTFIDSYDASGSSSATLLSSTDASLFGAVFLDGVAVDGAGGKVYASGSGVMVFSPSLVTLPDVSTNVATNVTPTKATLHGTVNPDGQVLTECLFEYGMTGFEHTVPCSKSFAEIGSGSAPVAVEAEIGGLQFGEKSYSYRLVANNANAVPIMGSSQTFLTQHLAVTGVATDITGTAATLNATVNPGGAAVTECLFEYGTTTSYGETVPCAESEAEIGSGEASLPIHADVAGLQPATLYYFRISTVGGAGSEHGLSSLPFATPGTAATGSADSVGPAGATLHGTVNPQGSAITECLFEYGTTTSYGETVPCAESEAEIGSGEAPVAVHAVLSGLQSGIQYHFRLRAANAGGSAVGSDEGFLTRGPSVGAQWVSSVSGTEAALRASINPRGTATTFHLEYGPEGGAFEFSTPESGPIGNDASDHPVATQLAHLEPGTAYVYRFVADSYCNAAEPSELCVSPGAVDSFVTPAPATAPAVDCSNQAFRTGYSAALPDCRAYEMVSPIDKNNGDIGAEEQNLDQAAPEGNKLTYSSYIAFGEALSAPFASQYIASRHEGEGWSSENISPPHEGPAFADFLPLYNSYFSFTDDLCASWLLQESEPLLAPGGIPGYNNLYRRNNCGTGRGTYEALSTVKPPHFQPDESSSLYLLGVGGYSADGTHTVIRAHDKLTADGSDEEGIYQLYESDGSGGLVLVSVMPDGTAAAESSVTGTLGNSLKPTDRLYDSVHNAVSNDGSRVYFTSGSQNFLYLRENALQPQSPVGGGECTDPALACTTAIPGARSARFWTADPEGKTAIFTASESLYEFDAETNTSTLIAEKVEGLMGWSEDAKSLFLVSREALGGANGEGKAPTAGQPNLYLHDPSGFTFIGTLAAVDVSAAITDSRLSPIAGYPSFRAARVSADGRHAVFLSAGRLGAYDNTDQKNGEPDAEVYAYDANSRRLHCVSCNPTGARPVGREISVSGANHYWGSAWIPGWPDQFHASRVLSDDGSRIFFNSFEALVPRDTNGREDVYEWELAGTGDCSEGDPSYSASAGGCVRLISSGQSASDSEFVDASASGRDAFFTTSQSLVPQDPSLIDIYDARELGGFAPPASPPSGCEGEACQSPPEPPNDRTPASLSFQGPGNATEPKARSKRCAKGKARRKGVCVTKKRKQHRPASHRRRASR